MTILKTSFASQGFCHERQNDGNGNTSNSSCCRCFAFLVLEPETLDVQSFRQEQRAQTQTFGSGYLPVGRGVFHVNGWGPKSSVCPSKPREKITLPSPSKSALFCRTRATAQSLERLSERGNFRIDLSTKFGTEIPSRNLCENRSVKCCKAMGSEL